MGFFAKLAGRTPAQRNVTIPDVTGPLTELERLERVEALCRMIHLRVPTMGTIVWGVFWGVLLAAIATLLFWMFITFGLMMVGGG